MAQIISTLSDAIGYINSLYEGDTSAPTSGEDDFTYWTSLINIAVNMWETEEGMLWKELFVKLADASDGDKTTVADTHSYTLPTNFKFHAGGYVWIGSGTSKTALKVINPEQYQLYANTEEHVCWFTATTLEFNPNMTVTGGYTINYDYYKYATKLASGTDTFEMSDPMFAVYYALSELRKDEGDTTSGAIATQKLEAMKTKNIMPGWLQDTFTGSYDEGFGS